MTLARFEPATPRSRVKHSTTEPLRSLKNGVRLYIGLHLPVMSVTMIDTHHTEYEYRTVNVTRSPEKSGIHSLYPCVCLVGEEESRGGMGC